MLQFSDIWQGIIGAARKIPAAPADQSISAVVVDSRAAQPGALFIALRRGYHVTAVPIDWYFDADSRIEPLRDTWRMFRDVLRIRVNGWRGVYDK